MKFLLWLKDNYLKKEFALIILLVLIILYAFNLGYAEGELLHPVDYSAEHAQDEILVKFKRVCSQERINQICESLDIIKIKKKIPDKPLYLLEIPYYKSVEDVINEITEYPEVRYAQPNYVLRKRVTPNDTYYAANQATYMNLIDATSAWDTRRNAGSIVVAVIDAGVDWQHLDLDDNIWSNSDEPVDGVDNDGNGYVDDRIGWDCVNDDPNPSQLDSANISHGTFISGIIGAEGNNSGGITGVCWGAKIMPLTGATASGYSYVSDFVEALNYAVANGAKIVNYSYGGPSYSAASDEAIKDAGDAGVLFITAAGNSTTNIGTTPDYPTWYGHSNIISVAATNSSDNLAWFSNYGNKVNIAAPGASLYSTRYAASLTDIDNTSNYQTGSGTSYAAPMVAGACALVWASDTSLSHIEVKNKVLNGAESISSLNGYIPGSRRLNLNNALTASSDRISTTNLLGYWKFDQSGNSMGADSSGKVNHLTRSTKRPTLQTGKYSNAARCVAKVGKRKFFYISNSYQKDLDITGNLTIGAWIKITKFRAGKRIFIVKRGKNYKLFIKKSGRKLVFKTGSSTVVGSTGLSVNTWHHVAAVKDGTTMRVYVDGVEDGSGTVVSGDTSPNARFYVGKGKKKNNNINAVVLYDDLAIWGRALSGDEILKLYAM